MLNSRLHIFTVDDGILHQVETRTQSQLSDINLSPEVIRKFMCKLPNKCTPLYYLFRQSLNTCPSLWKSPDITPVYKKGDASLASNARPISITPAICRLFERILADSINYHMHAHNLITDSQYGFVKGRSTELQLLNCNILNWVSSFLNNRKQRVKTGKKFPCTKM